MNFNVVANIILSPHITEKATMIGDKGNQYVFKVAPKSTKPQIKQAVEKMFEVQVDSVRVLNVKGKQKRFGTQIGRRKGWKKAYVRLKDGQSIAMIEAE